jgi:two-component system, response regulator PdtaR
MWGYRVDFANRLGSSVRQPVQRFRRRAGANPDIKHCVPMTPTSRLSPVTVLIVENEALVRLELVDWLEEKGLLVLEAGDADQAIALLNSHPEIEILLTDIMMPGSLDGVRLAHHVRHRWPPVKIIIVSGLIDTQPSELPFDTIFIPKPYEHQTLWGAMSHLTQGGRPSPAPRRAPSRV